MVAGIRLLACQQRRSTSYALQSSSKNTSLGTLKRLGISRLHGLSHIKRSLFGPGLTSQLTLAIRLHYESKVSMPSLSCT